MSTNTKKLSHKKSAEELQEIQEGNKSTGLCGVWKDKFSEGQPTYKLLSDGTAQFTKEDSDVPGRSSTSGFGTWELSPDGKVIVSCQVKQGCQAEGDAVNGKEEHVLTMHAMMFEGVFKRQKELNDRDEERVRMLAEGQEVPPLHSVTVIESEGDEKAFDLFADEKLSDLKNRMGIDANMKIHVMLGDVELKEGEPICKLVPANGVLRLMLPKKEDEEKKSEAAPANAAAEEKKQKISEAFKKWDVNNEGLILEQELGRILVALGVPQDTIPTIFSNVGTAKKDGKVDYMEFINLIYSSGTPTPANQKYKELYAEKIEIIQWMFPHVPDTVILDMLVEKNGDRPAVTQALLTQYGSKPTTA